MGPKSRLSGLKERIAGLSTEQRQALLKRMNSTDVSQSVELAPDIQKIAAISLEKGKNQEGKEVTVEIYPASHTQERMWFLQEYSDHAPVYSSAMAYHLKGEVLADQLETSFCEVVRRHGNLRSTFRKMDEGLRQCLHREGSFSMVQNKIRGKIEDRQKHAVEFIDQEV